MEVLACADPLGQHMHMYETPYRPQDPTGAYRRCLIKELRWALEQGFTLLEAREYLGLNCTPYISAQDGLHTTAAVDTLLQVQTSCRALGSASDACGERKQSWGTQS